MKLSLTISLHRHHTYHPAVLSTSPHPQGGDPSYARPIIFHADCNSFFASCECLERPELKTIPMAVAGDPENRHGIVVAKNEIAKRYGVKTTDTVYAARQKCPGMVFVPPRHHFYSTISRRVNEIYLQYISIRRKG